MSVLFTCKIEEDPIKHESAIVVTILNIDFSDAQGQLTPQSVMESHRTFTYKNEEEDLIKNKDARVLTAFLPFGSRAANSVVSGRIGPKFELSYECMEISPLYPFPIEL